MAEQRSGREPEERQARLVRALPESARSRAAAWANYRDVTAIHRQRVLQALDAGMTTRRVAELAEVSLDTVNRWHNAARRRDEASGDER